ncbi:MAG: hypothetical protein H7A30_07360 [Thermotogae bacterium]|nr:hypothetical protein [Thermotogota bacterium]
MKKILILIVVLLPVIFFTLAGNLDYKNGYFIRNDYADIYQIINTENYFENYMDYSYYKISLELSMLYGLSANQDEMYEASYLLGYRDIEMFIPGLDEITHRNIMYLSLGETYYDIYLSTFSVRAGRIYPVKGSGIFYSPSNVIQAQNSFGFISGNTDIPYDGLNLKIYRNNINAEIFYTPVKKYDFPELVPYTETEKITERIKNYTGKEYDAEKTAYNFLTKETVRFDDINFGLFFYSDLNELSLKTGYFHNYYHFNIPERVDIISAENKINYIFSVNDLSIDLSELPWPEELLNQPGFSEAVSDVQLSTDFSTTVYSETLESTSNLVTPYADIFTVDFQASSEIWEGINYYSEISFFLPQNINTVTNLSQEENEYNFNITVEGTSAENINYNYSENNVKKEEKIFSQENILKSHYFKFISGINYNSGTSAAGFEFFNSMPAEHITFSPGFNFYWQYENKKFSLSGALIFVFPEINGKIDPGYLFNFDINYKEYDNFRFGLKTNLSYAENDNNPFYSLKYFDSFEFYIKSYF